jgi:hypothetical protein
MKYKFAPYEDLIYADITKLGAAFGMPEGIAPTHEIIARLCQAAVIQRHGSEDSPFWADNKRHLPYTPGYYSWITEDTAQSDITDLVRVLQARWEREIKSGLMTKAALAKAALPGHKLQKHEAQVLADVEVLITSRGAAKAPGVGVVASLVTLAALHRSAPDEALAGTPYGRSLPYDPELYAWATAPDLKDEDIMKLVQAVSISLYLKALQ